MESALGLSVDERIAIEEAAAGAETWLSLSEGRAANFWLSHFTNAFCVVSDFCGLIQLLDRWTVCVRGELELRDQSLTYSKFQGSSF